MYGFPRKLLHYAFYLIIILVVSLFLFVVIKMKNPEAERVKIIDILQNPEKFEGKKVWVSGKFYGWKIPTNLTGPPDKSPPKTRSDWIVADNTGWIYVVAGNVEPNLDPINDIGKDISVLAIVRVKILSNNNLCPYLDPLEIKS